MRSWIETNDGSLSLYVDELDETYHSRHGAVTESLHVFIENGLNQFANNSDVNILEVGFGTGTNCMLTISEALNRKVYYRALEPKPLTPIEWSRVIELGMPLIDNKFLKAIVSCTSHTKLSESFDLEIIKSTLQEAALEPNSIDLIYYDAFGPRAQPEMWTVDCFQKLYNCMKTGGILVTYCAKGQVRRDLKSCGFEMERLPGPPGKREMLRATKVGS
ncbi:MAG: tRNA U34 5-methylaminomethyl-2-thiouridine-forming methyltransferase MnmC [Litorivivens sp.]|jgi:tRNA U34 5-methylaminomethyl-2-thiouridine-forming methyltransferase MnmC